MKSSTTRPPFTPGPEIAKQTACRSRTDCICRAETGRPVIATDGNQRVLIFARFLQRIQQDSEGCVERLDFA